jgi:hypothetical protein
MEMRAGEELDRQKGLLREKHWESSLTGRSDFDGVRWQRRIRRPAEGPLRETHRSWSGIGRRTQPGWRRWEKSRNRQTDRQKALLREKHWGAESTGPRLEMRWEKRLTGQTDRQKDSLRGQHRSSLTGQKDPLMEMRWEPLTGRRSLRSSSGVELDRQKDFLWTEMLSSA